MEDVTIICCRKCGRETVVNLDVLRDAIERDLVPPCHWCSAIQIKDGRRKRSRTAAELVLIVVYSLNSRNNSDVFRSDIVVESWLTDRSVFGLRGVNEEYPDAKRVDTELSHLVNYGYIARVRPLYYIPTQNGISKARALLQL